MTNYKVVIPSAGVGSRIGPYTKTMNKALVQIGKLPTIAHIINQFPIDVEIIIILGYRGDHVKQICEHLYPSRNIKYIYVDKYEGEGSGLGRTLNAAKSLLQCPFIFCPNDTIFTLDVRLLDPTAIGNWAGYYKKKNSDDINLNEYRTLHLSGSEVLNILPKGVSNSNVYTGICGVYDYAKFWEFMAQPESVEIGESFGLKMLSPLSAIKVSNWYDTGNLSSIATAKQAFKMHDVNLLEKEDEGIYFQNKTVTKFHVSEDFISQRVERLKYLHETLFPKIVKTSKNAYSYQLIEADVLSRVIDLDLVEKLLNQMQDKMWMASKKTFSSNEKNALVRFYKNKTQERIEHYLTRFESVDRSVRINCLECPPAHKLLDRLDWENLISKSKLGKFHGDFHAENILVNTEGFKLIDWRQNFGELGLEYGDVYYDLAKFLHGLIVSHDEVNKENFSVNKTNTEVLIDISQKMRNIEAIDYFKNWCGQHNYSFSHVEFITSLIYLNIAGLHEHPYSEFLFYLGKYLLTKWVNENEKNI